MYLNPPQEVEEVIKTVCQVHGVTEEELKKRFRGKQYVSDARQQCMYILWHQGLTMTTIGKIFKRDHSTVVYAVKVVPDRLKNEERYQELYNQTTQCL